MDRLCVAILASLVAPLYAVCSTPATTNCEVDQPIDFSLDIGACAQFEDLPKGEATCNISAITSTSGTLCWYSSKQDVSLCFGDSCYGAGGLVSPTVINWNKPAGIDTLTVTSLHSHYCTVNVARFLYCCKAKPTVADIDQVERSSSSDAASMSLGSQGFSV
mmetsp:Transcript_101267/g.253873  ORF Transcript_101267/g.253873 Transcript_101267/m.253873 type:complete len:162 (+) Transcript_101267:82-567(+)